MGFKKKESQFLVDGGPGEPDYCLELFSQRVPAKAE
jgi:hypothetical protein